jgi:hypothetical protein
VRLKECRIYAQFVLVLVFRKNAAELVNECFAEASFNWLVRRALFRILRLLRVITFAEHPMLKDGLSATFLRAAAS